MEHHKINSLLKLLNTLQQTQITTEIENNYTMLTVAKSKIRKHTPLVAHKDHILNKHQVQLETTSSKINTMKEEEAISREIREIREMSN